MKNAKYLTAEEQAAAAREQSTYTAEQCVIGGLILNAERADDIDISVDDFSRNEHRLIFRAVIALRRQRIDVDVITVSDYLTREGEIEAAGGLSYIGSLALNTPSHHNVASYARIVKNAAVGRRSVGLMHDAMSEMMDNNPSEVIDKLITDLMQLTDASGRGYESSIGDAALLAINRLDYLSRNPGQLVGVTTGIEKLDVITGGLQGGDLYVIGARPAMGKTALLLNFAAAAGKAGHAAGLYSAEQPRIQIGQRMLALFGRVVAARMRVARLDDADWPRLTQAMQDLQKLPLYLNDRSGSTITQVHRQARRWKHDRDIKILYVDYLQLIKGTNPRAPKNERVGEVAEGLKDIARELDIPVCALAQVNREVEKRDNKRPGMADLADSSEIEKHADGVMTLYRDEVYHRDTEYPGVAEIGISKNRHGPTGKAYVKWEKQFMAFETLRKEEASNLTEDDADARGGDA